ncbi:MAG: T9SS C-terminal target domain-containing protein [Ignavibacteriae bacterium]|nr:MAG: T9SS C-terminal target domain-containing protein [Ignavibacteriota bacterium]
MKKIILITIMCCVISGNTYSQWVEKNYGGIGSPNTVYAVNDNVCWIAGNSFFVAKTTNGGNNWINISGVGSSWQIRDMYAVDHNIAFVLGGQSNPNFSRVYKTTDGGANWVFIMDFVKLCYTINFNSLDSGMIIGVNENNSKITVWRTFNGGTLWDSSSGNLSTISSIERPTYRCLFMLGTRTWFYTTLNRVFYSSNFGNSWSVQQLSTSYSTLNGNIWFNNPTLGMASCDKVPSSTTNGGINWISMTEPNGLFDNIGGLIGSGNKFWCGYGLNVNLTTNNGATWTVVYTAPSGSFLDMSLARNGLSAWAIRDNFGICKNATLLGISPISTEIPSSYNLYQNYPNPFNPSTKIQFQIPHSRGVSAGRGVSIKLTIFDMLGKEIAVLVNEPLSPGTYEIEWNASDYPSGVYFYRLITDGFTQTNKMILIK